MSISVDLDQVFATAENISVYNDGAVTNYPAGGEPFKKIVCCWQSMISGAHQMPAFGVSLNAQTVQAMQRGLWVEFDFGTRLESNEMPYEKLLINVNKSFYGFNLIRYNAAEGYDGRCFYYDLVGKNMDELYDLLLDL